MLTVNISVLKLNNEWEGTLLAEVYSHCVTSGIF
jgi:hypothetical protein